MKAIRTEIFELLEEYEHMNRTPFETATMCSKMSFLLIKILRELKQ